MDGFEGGLWDKERLRLERAVRLFIGGRSSQAPRPIRIPIGISEKNIAPQKTEYTLEYSAWYVHFNRVCAQSFSSARSSSLRPGFHHQPRCPCCSRTQRSPLTPTRLRALTRILARAPSLPSTQIGRAQSPMCAMLQVVSCEKRRAPSALRRFQPTYHEKHNIR
jgi:hypothetical protein